MLLFSLSTADALVVPFGCFGLMVLRTCASPAIYVRRLCTSCNLHAQNFQSRVRQQRETRGIYISLRLATGNGSFAVRASRPYCHTGHFAHIDGKHFACVTLLACSALVGCGGIEPPQAHQCTRIPYGVLLALLFLDDGEQQLARSPFGHGCVYVHIDTLPV